MKDVLSIIEKMYGSDTVSSNTFLSSLERIYFGYSVKYHKFLWMSEDYKEAQDIINLEIGMQLNTNLSTINLKSKKLLNDKALRNIIDNYSITDKTTIVNLKSQLINHKHVVAAAFAADLLNREAKKSLFRWFITIMISMASIMATILIENAR